MIGKIWEIRAKRSDFAYDAVGFIVCTGPDAALACHFSRKSKKNGMGRENLAHTRYSVDLLSIV